jgi:RNA polymerase sigma-70 factor (ECF subfamily)
MTTDDDSELRGLVAQGDMTGALRLVMQRYGNEVYRYCCQELRDPALADDVHQQVFIKVHKDLPRFRGKSSVRTWVFGIARHRVLDAVKARKRRNARHPPVTEPEQLANVPDLQPTADQRIDDQRLHAALLDCVDQLSPDARSAVLLRFQQGFTFDALGRILNKRPGTLQAAVTRALPVLRECIESRTGGTL